MALFSTAVFSIFLLIGYRMIQRAKIPLDASKRDKFDQINQKANQFILWPSLFVTLALILTFRQPFDVKQKIIKSIICIFLVLFTIATFYGIKRFNQANMPTSFVQKFISARTVGLLGFLISILIEYIFRLVENQN